jgi:hypothetical protein
MGTTYLYAILRWTNPFYFSGEFLLEAFGTSEDGFEDVEVRKFDHGDVGTMSDDVCAAEISVGRFGDHGVG